MTPTSRWGRRGAGLPAVLQRLPASPRASSRPGSSGDVSDAARRRARGPELARRGEPLLRDVPRQPRPPRAGSTSRPRTTPHRFDQQLTLALGCCSASRGSPASTMAPSRACTASATPTPTCARPSGASRCVRSQSSVLQGPRGDRDHSAQQPALRYGRQYFRQLSGDGVDFGISPFTPGVIAFSRILDAQEVLIVANTAEQGIFQGQVIVDATLNALPGTFRVLFSNIAAPEPGDADHQGSGHRPDSRNRWLDERRTGEGLAGNHPAHGGADPPPLIDGPHARADAAAGLLHCGARPSSGEDGRRDSAIDDSENPQGNRPSGCRPGPRFLR